jgi:hypothetical protein
MMTRVQRFSTVSSEIQRKEDPTLREVLHYPILMLKICGIYIEYHGDRFRLTSAVAAKLILNVICMIILISIVSIISAGFVSNAELSDKLMGRIVYAVMYISHTLTLPVFIFNTTKNLPSILSKFSMFQTKYGSATNMRKLKQMTTYTFSVHLFVILIVGICVIILTSYRILEESGLLISRLLPFSYKDGYVFDIVSIVDILAMQFCSIFIESVSLITFASSHIIIKEFREVRRKVDDAREEEAMSAIELQNLRQQHYDVTELLQIANNVIELNIFFGFMVLLPSICFSVYGIVYSTLEIYDLIFVVGAFLMQLVAMVLVIATGAKINSQVTLHYFF